MSNSIRFALVLHNHQPVGNFEHVFERAYQDSYHPLLEAFARHESLVMSLHTSGSLMMWLSKSHPEYVDRLAELAQQGRLEILGGAFYEPILAMIPPHDRVGQIRSYTEWLEDRLGATVRGMWIPERVWEQSYTRDLVDAGIEYCALDDFHFKNAGLEASQLAGYYVTEDDGRVMSIFPGSERLRYLIPFASPDQTIGCLAEVAGQQSDAIAVFADDGEKFGTWPGTKKHVYDDGWLERFFSALEENREWIHLSTLSEAVANVPPLGKIYLPDSSYREMTEWALPAGRLVQYEQLAVDMKSHPQWAALRQFIRGGFWRNFKVKYPESNEMYSRMMGVSRRLQQAGVLGKQMERARHELYQGQCNCAYWHGAFGGIYLPHLRNAVYQHLIAADNILEQVAGRPATWVEAKPQDLDFDGRREIQLANDKLVALLAPQRGGQLYELDIRSVCHNLLATLGRRPEAYHRQVLAGAKADHGECASIHDQIVFKQEKLNEKLYYDDHARKSLVDLFYPGDATLESVATCRATQCGDFADGVYEARVRRNPERIQVQLSRQGAADGLPVRITKGVTLDAGGSMLEIAYLLEDLPADHPLHFAVEFNFAGMPGGPGDRRFYDESRQPLGQLDAQLDLRDASSLGLVDPWLGVDVGLRMSRPTHFWTFPIETVSQSESGFELVHQSVAVLPHWIVTADADGRWSVSMRIAIDTSHATNHVEDPVIAAT